MEFQKYNVKKIRRKIKRENKQTNKNKQSLETPGTSVFPWSETGMLGNFGVASRVPSSISNFKMERGTSLETLAVKGLILR